MCMRGVNIRVCVGRHGRSCRVSFQYYYAFMLSTAVSCMPVLPRLFTNSQGGITRSSFVTRNGANACCCGLHR